MDATLRFRKQRQRGAGLVETMVGILIGMIVVLAIYNVFALTEGHKRAAVGAADAQVTGMFAQMVLAREIANGGNGISDSALTFNGNAALQLCDPAILLDANWVNPKAFQPPATVAVRPIPVLLADGGAATASDSIIVNYSTAPRVVWPVLFTANMGKPSDDFVVQSPNGFRKNDHVIAIDTSGNCESTTITGVVGPDATGNVTLSHPALNFSYKSSTRSTLVNLGQDDNANPQRQLFDVANEQLRTTNLLANAPANPIAQNVVLLKAQYGVDCNSNGVITWTSATASNLCGDGVNYTPADLQAVAFTPARLARIRAIRVGIVVRSDEPDLKQPPDPAVVAATRTPVVLFNCSLNTTAGCPGRIVVPAGAVAAVGNATCAPALICDTWRYRTYETVVPLRNTIWN